MGIVDKLNQLMNPDSVEDYDDGDYMFGDEGDTGYGADYQQPGYSQAPGRRGPGLSAQRAGAQSGQAGKI